MNLSDKKIEAYKTIGEVAKELNLIDKKTGILQTHTIRYWEKCFKQVKPILRAGKRRYYSIKNIQSIKRIIILLKVEGYTINGVKKLLSSNKTAYTRLDDNNSIGVEHYRNKSIDLKKRVEKISKLVKKLKDY